MAPELADIDRARSRGYFTPEEDERVRARFARYLTARAALLQTIEELRPVALAPNGAVDEDRRLRALVIAYAAAALLVRAARTLVDRLASDTFVQRKLNEPEPRFGIPRKQFTAIYKALTDPMTAWHLRRAARFIEDRRRQVETLLAEPDLAGVLDVLRAAEPALDLPKRSVVRARMSYRWHALRRRRASAVGHAMFGIFELAGRVIADLRNPFHDKRVTPNIRAELEAMLEPGDVLISRHDDAMSNLFLPGYWIHASLHIGSESVRRALNHSIDADRAARWIDPISVLEARKD